jgi:hypothetical protein
MVGSGDQKVVPPVRGAQSGQNRAGISGDRKQRFPRQSSTGRARLQDDDDFHAFQFS